MTVTAHAIRFAYDTVFSCQLVHNPPISGIHRLKVHGLGGVTNLFNPFFGPLT
jgi:hypothetical protein